MKSYRLVLIVSLIQILILSLNLPVAATTQPDLKLESAAALLLEPLSGEVLYEKQSGKQLPPASVTKLMVMLLVLEALERGDVKLTDQVTASSEACKMGGSQIWLEPGEQMTVGELLKAVSIVSANDASYTLAEHLAGSEENFIKLMNEHARKLGLKETVYINTTGLEPDSGGPGNQTSARDMAALAREVLKHPLIFQWTGTWIDYLRGGKSFLRNTNRLVRFYPGCDGLKTGFTAEAGFCLVATAKREGVRMVAVVMKAETDKIRARDITKLFNYGFSIYKANQIYKGGEKVGRVKVFRGTKPKVDAVVAGELTAVVKRGEKGTLQKTVRLVPLVKAPLAAGTKVGEVILTLDGKVCGRIDLKTAVEVKRASLFQIWGEIFRNMFAGMVGGINFRNSG